MGLNTAVIGSGVLMKGRLFKGAKERNVKTKYGKASVFLKGNIALILRHGIKNNIPPHKINHKANIAALNKLGIKNIISVNSVGSMSKSIRPGSIVVPDDYIQLRGISTFYDKKIVHSIPVLSESLRSKILSAARKIKINAVKKAVYLQTTGPRLETKAEVALMKNYADIVGMTMASEATLANEIGMNYAAVCSIDNYAHGIESRKLDNNLILEKRNRNFKIVEMLLKKTLETLK